MLWDLPAAGRERSGYICAENFLHFLPQKNFKHMKNSNKKSKKTSTWLKDKPLNDGGRKKKLKPQPRLKYKHFDLEDDK